MVWDEARLLALEVDAIYGLVPRPGGGLPVIVKNPAVRAVWAWSPQARLLALGAGVSSRGHEDGGGPEFAPGEPPAPLVRLAASIAERPLTVEGGPCFVFPERLTASRPVPLPILVPTDEGRRAARHLVRPDNWQPGEWHALLGGRMGPWAMAVYDGEPVSICFSPASNATASEAGIWARADFRGRGLAPAVVAAWAAYERRTKEVLFYSTTAANHASQSVARRLGLTPLGWIWTVR
ncbi:GNAT family N-acetyltransferase [Streptomyces sp. NPDC059063]|uniref:GNAT family N-acetyltransferase n=1 Tax=unclassified Streptomyces TaxID=2593676 RepID=UPI0036A5794D